MTDEPHKTEGIWNEVITLYAHQGFKNKGKPGSNEVISMDER